MPLKGLKEVEKAVFSELNTETLVRFIAGLQKPSGDIPWYEGGKTDPWDLVESAMGLNTRGYHEAAAWAFEWLKKNQNPDGSWYSAYMDGAPLDRTRETHMATYIATGLFHAWLIKKDTAFLAYMWETMQRGIDFALGLQTDRGEIFWAKSPRGEVDRMALLTGSSSIYMSLKCALSVAFILGKEMKGWEKAFSRLENSLKKEPHVYNISKSRYAMYWFYPVLSGAVSGEKARDRIDKYWRRYVIDGQGVRCVIDRPWVTIAETSELVLALAAAGRKKLANIVFSWIQGCRFDDNTFWCGYTWPDMTVWPEEKISWTNAVVLMAADALFDLTPASDIFRHESWDGFVYTRLVN